MKFNRLIAQLAALSGLILSTPVPLFAVNLIPNPFVDSGSRSEGGVAGGGGGNLDQVETPPSQPLAHAKVIEAANTVLPLVKLYLLSRAVGMAPNSEIVLPPEMVDPAVFIKKFRTMQLSFRAKGPCIDEEHAKVDAAVLEGPLAKICLSLERLAPQLNESDRFNRIFALLAHEAIHWTGLPHALQIEAQLQALQMQVDAETPSKLAQFQNEERDNAFRHAEWAREVIVKIDASRSPAEICASVRQVRDIPPATDPAPPFSFFPMTWATFERATAFRSKAWHLQSACQTEDDPAKSWLISMFKGEGQVSIQRFTGNMGMNPVSSPGAVKIMIRYPRYHDLAVMRAELEEIEQLGVAIAGEVMITREDAYLSLEKPIGDWADEVLAKLKEKRQSNLAGVSIAELQAVVARAKISFAGEEQLGRNTRIAVNTTRDSVKVNAGLWVPAKRIERIQLVFEGALALMKGAVSPETARQAQAMAREVQRLEKVGAL